MPKFDKIAQIEPTIVIGSNLIIPFAMIITIILVENLPIATWNFSLKEFTLTFIFKKNLGTFSFSYRLVFLMAKFNIYNAFFNCFHKTNTVSNL